MIKKYTLLGLCLFLFQGLCAQEEQEKTQRSRKTSADIRLELNGLVGVASRDISTFRMRDLSSSEFFDAEMKRTFLDELEGTVNFGYAFNWDVGFYYDYRKRGHVLSDAYGLSIFHRGYLGISAPKSGIELALLGNKPFAGQTINMDGTAYETWLYTGLRYQFSVEIKEQRLQLGVAVIFGHEHSKYKFSNLSLYTEPDGSYLDVEANYALEEYNTSFLYGLAGMGAAADMAYKAEKGNSAFTLEVKDLGFAYFTRGKNAFADSNFRFSGIEISNIFDVKDSLIDAQTGQLENDLWYKGNGRRLALLPFNAQVEYIYAMSNKGFTRAFGRLDYLNLFGYVPRIAAAVEYALLDDHRVQLELAYGGFNATTVGLRYEAFLGKQWYVYLEADNLPGLLFQTQAMGSFAQIGVHHWIF